MEVLDLVAREAVESAVSLDFRGVSGALDVDGGSLVLDFGRCGFRVRPNIFDAESGLDAGAFLEVMRSLAGGNIVDATESAVSLGFSDVSRGMEVNGGLEALDFGVRGLRVGPNCASTSSASSNFPYSA